MYTACNMFVKALTQNGFENVKKIARYLKDT